MVSVKVDDNVPISTSDVKVAVKIRMGSEGISALPPTTVMQSFGSICSEHGDRIALHQKKHEGENSTAENSWKTWTWNEYRANVDAFGKSLIFLGIQRFDTINIIGFNSPELFFANFGTIAAGGVPACIYTTNKQDACKYIAGHSKAKVIVCEGTKQLEKFYGISNELPQLKALVMYGNEKLPVDIKEKCSVPCYTFEQFLQLGSDVSDDEIKNRSDAWSPGETCTLIYTSGTTGPPKAVMITNDNLTWTAKSLYAYTSNGYISHEDILVSYLPLSHIAAQMIDMHVPIATGCQVYFAEPDALKGSLADTLKEVRPTRFFGVPRVWEKIYEKLQKVSSSLTGVSKLTSDWAKSTTSDYWDAMDFDAKKQFVLSRDFPVKYYLSRTILHQVHKKLGFDRCIDYFASAAPMDVKILKYFASIDIPIMELFGQSECTGPHAINTVHAFKFGTVGRPMVGTETKIDEDKGELCYRGRHIFAGYMGMEDQTKEAIDEDGWLHSGDLATIDDNDDEHNPKPSGFLTITGRIKELIITAGGENVPPGLIESQLKEAMPCLSNVMVIGDKRKFLSALFCLQVEIDSNGLATNKLKGDALNTSREIGSSATTTEEARNCPQWKAYFDEGVQKANSKATSRAQQVAKWSLLPTDFTEKGKELTPTLKLKRAVAAEKYSDIIDSMYDAN